MRARLLLLIAAAMLPLIGLILTGLYVSFRDAELEAHRNIANETRIGAARIARVFDDAREFLATLRHMPQVLKSDQSTCNTLLAGLKAERPQFITIGVIARDRSLICRSQGRTSVLFADQALFEAAVNARGNHFLVGDFVLSSVGRHPTMAVAMRLPPTTGPTSGGVVYASLNLPLIENEIRSMSEATGHAWSIVQPGSSRILVSWPHVADFGTVAPDFSLLPLLRKAHGGQTASATDLTGEPTLYGFEPIRNAQNAGLWLTVGASPSEVFAAVKHRMHWTLTVGEAALAIALAGTALLAYWMQLRPIALLSRSAARIGAGDVSVRTGMERWQAPEFRRLGQLVDTAARTLAHAKAAEEAVAAGQRHFKLVADTTVDMISCLDAAGNRTLVTGARRRILGYDPAELTGQSPLGICLDEDRPLLRSTLDTLRSGDEVNGIRHRVRRKDESIIGVELSGRPMDDAGGCVISLRDVDQRQRTEEALAGATRQLEMLAATDELTRLANRRTFNRRREEAFAQARNGADVSLLLLHVDRFKAFNDRYGHPAGDRCLAVVSEILTACVRKDDEIGARYGGEELALILPGAGPAEAMARAEAIRRAVLDRAIPHEGAEAGLLTVNIGIASRSDLAVGKAGPADILQAADEALYAAKAGGRNQVRARAA